MKKLLKLSLVGIGLVVSLVLPSKAATLSSSVFTNQVFTNFPGLPVTLPHVIKQIIIANPSAFTNTLYFYDVPTNVLTQTNAQYTNTVSYLTNYVQLLTNYYGYVTTGLTNVVLFDNTNNVVLAGTNTIPAKMVLTVQPGTSLKFDSVNYYFYNGLWVSNGTGPGSNSAPVITITYQ